MNVKQLAAKLDQLLRREGAVDEQIASLKIELQNLQVDHQQLQVDHQQLQADRATSQQQHTAALAREQQLRCDYEALLHSTKTLVADRERLQNRVAELEAADKKLTDMLWGRRSERREDSDQLKLWDEPTTELSKQQLAVITAAAEAQRLSDEDRGSRSSGCGRGRQV